MADKAPAAGSLPQGCDVIVVGGGLVGLSSAWHLAKRGLSVCLLERDYCGRHSSGVNAGGVRTMGRHEAEIPLALASRDEIWRVGQEVVGQNLGFVSCGQLQVLETDQDVQNAQQRVQQLASLGYHHEVMISQEEVRALVPAMAPHVRGGIWVEGDGHAWPYGAVMAFYQAAQAAGVHIHENHCVTQVRQRGSNWVVSARGQTFTAPALVNAAGAWAGQLAQQLGDPVPVTADGLMLMVTQRTASFLSPVLGGSSRPLSLKQFANGTVVIGGGLRCQPNLTDRVADVDLLSLAPSAHTVRSLFPHLAQLPVAHAWGGVEAFLPDGIPVLGPSRNDAHVIHAFGFSAHGFELGPIAGRIVSELLCDGTSRLPVSPFSVGRFF